MGGSNNHLVPFRQLFRYASTCDRFCITIAIISAAISGACIPICNIFTGKIAALLTSIDGQWECNKTSSRPQFVKGVLNRKIFERNLSNLSLLLAISGIFQLVFAYVATWLFCHVAEKQTYRLRINYLRALLRQDIAWYDTTSDSSFLTRLAEDVRKIQEAIGVKLGLFIYYGNNSLICLGIALYHGWVLALVSLTAFPISILIALVFHAIVTRFAVKTQAQFSKCGSIVQQTVTNIKTVMAFNGQGKQATKYSSALAEIRGVQSKQAFITGAGLGLSHGLKHCSYGLAIWYAATLYFDEVSRVCKAEPVYGVSTLMIICFCILDFQQNLTNCLALVETFSNGRGAATAIFAVIDRKPGIDSLSFGGIRTEEQLKGKVEFRDVHFSYPARSEAKILQGLNLIVEPGKTVALVGASGCGKSTCLQLLQRFYDPTVGAIFVDGTDIKGYNLQWYRSQLAVVNQEPSLFNGTIGENILYGNPEATNEEIQDAIVRSGVQSFVSELPDKFDTFVGDRGAQLSGGQKQRIAICRVMLQSPSILLLDEVTSALDVASEAAVTAAINEMKRGRTTLIIAHRISTLKSADTIAMIQDGRIVLQESPEELRKRTELYIGRLLKESHEDNGSVHSLMNTYGKFESSAGDEHQHVPMSPAGSTKQKEEEVRRRSSTKEILSLAFRERKERCLLLVGLLMCAAQGVVLPLTGFVFGQSLRAFSKDSPQDGKHLVNGFAIMFLYLGLITFITNSASVALFGFAGAALTTRLRNLSFVAILRQKVSWFQMPENNVGAVCSRLARDVASVQEATGTHLGLFLSAASSIFVSVVLCFSLHWKLAFVGWAFSPLLMIGAYLNGKMVAAQEGAENDAHAKASNLAFQAINNIRPVTTLCLQDYFVEKFTEELSKTHRSAKRRAHLLGLVFGTSQALSHFAFAAVLYYGGKIVQDGSVGYPTVFTIGEALVWTMLDVGRTLAYLPNVTRAKMAAHRILTLLRSNNAQNFDNIGTNIYSCKGKLGFEDVTFAYPMRRNVAALREVSWDLPANGHIGICGPSGSGKSTTIELLLRFYDPDSGRILLDKTDMKSIKLESLRSKIAIVSQEPVLFDDAIVENIAYGLESGPRRLEVVIKAAEMANIHDFIMSLPNGYSTRLGGNGTQLSGGQKQRIAIARALARTPRILILDEATSALDAESEKSVEKALENSREGRTCVSVAHKLECIQNADKIIVMAKGRVVQIGTHEELVSQNGLYAYLWSLQSAQLT